MKSGKFTTFWLLCCLVFLLSSCGVGSNNDKNIDIRIPQNLIANAGSRVVELSWQGVPGATSYTVYWSTNETVDTSSAAAIETKEPYFQHHNLANGMIYHYKVSAYTAAGESELSREAVGTPKAAAPEIPGQIKLKAEDQRITIDFSLAAGAVKYQILWSSKANDQSPHLIDDVLPPFVHTGLQNDQTYFYKIVAINSENTSSQSGELSSTPHKALPTAPVIIKALAGKGQVEISWEDASNVENYNLYWDNKPEVDNSDAVIKDVRSPYVFAPIEDEKQIARNYYFRLVAINESGASPLSNELQITTPNISHVSDAGLPPKAPPRIDIEGKPAMFVTVQDRQLTLNWHAALGEEVIGYNLYWRKVSDVKITQPLIDKENYDGVIRNVTPPYTHVGLTNGATYYYRFSALNNAGESELSDLPMLWGKPEPVKPGVPTGVNATVGDERLVISWNPVERATAYNLSLIDDGETVVYSNATSPFILDKLENDKNYRIYVQAISNGVASEASTKIDASPRQPPPLAPTKLIAIPGDKKIVLQWQSALAQNPDDTGEKVLAYKVYYNTRSGVTTRNGKLLSDIQAVEYDDSGLWQVEIPSLLNGQRYYFVVSATNRGGESGASVEAWAMPQELIPNAPHDVYAEAGNNQVIIHFSGVEGLKEPVYNLYWSKQTTNGRSATEVITNIPQSPPYVFTDGESNGTAYYFQVSAASAGGESVLSPEVFARPQLPAPDMAPQDFVAKSQNGKVILNWQNVDQATSYAIYWSTSPNVVPGESARLVSNDGSIGFTHNSLNNGQTYYYRIAAFNAGGEGPASAVILASPQVSKADVAKTFTAKAGDSLITLNWEESQHNKDTNSTYILYWNGNNTEPASQWRQVRGIQSGYVLTALENGHIYYLKLLAHNAGGDSIFTETLAATPKQEKIPPPAMPSGFKATAGDEKVFLNWDQKPGLVYNLYWTTLSQGDPIDVGEAINDINATYIHGSTTPLSNGTLYRYQLTASNGGGEGEPTAVINAQPITPVANAPKSLSATADVNQITLTWLAPDNARTDTHYTLYFSTNSITSLKQNTSVIENVTSPYIHQNLAGGTKYFYIVTATNPDAVEGPGSSQISSTALVALPDTPMGLQATVGNREIDLSWQASARATQYLVEYSLNGTFTDKKIITVNAPTTSYRHTNLANNTEVFYRVRAVNKTGSSSASDVISATPYVINIAPQFSSQPTDRTNQESQTISAFSVSASDADGDSLIYSASGYPAGIVFNTATATFSGTISATAGRSTAYQVSVTADDQTGTNNATTTTQFNWQINDVLTSASRSTVSFSPVIDSAIDSPIVITVTARDANGNQRQAGGDDVKITIGGTNAGASNSGVLDQGDGRYTFGYTPTLAGQDTYTITINNVAVYGSPFSRQILTAPPVLSKTTLSATSGPITAGNQINLTASLLDSNDQPATAANVSFVITGANARTISGTYNDLSKNYQASYTPVVAGADTIEVSIDSVTVNNLSVSRDIIGGAISLSNTAFSMNPAYGSGTLDGPVTFTVTTRDVYGNPSYDISNSVVITIGGANSAVTPGATIDNGDGSYSMTYQPVNVGWDYYYTDINSGAYSTTRTNYISPGAPVFSTLELNVPPGPFSVMHNTALFAYVEDQFGNPTWGDIRFQINGANTADVPVFSSTSYVSERMRNETHANYVPQNLGTDTITATYEGTPVAGFSVTRTVGPNRPPVASAGQDFVALKDSTVTLDGRHSTDPENDNLTYTWAMTGKPANSNAVLSSTTSYNPSFTADQLGNYTFTLRVNDSFDDSQNIATLKVVAREAHKLDAPSTKSAPQAAAKIVVNDRGDRLAIWNMTNGAYQKALAAYQPYNGSWQAESVVFEYNSNYQLLSYGNLFLLVYQGNGGIKVKEFDGNSWSTDSILFNNSGGFFIERSDTQGIMVATSRYVNSQYEIAARHYAFNNSTGQMEWNAEQIINLPVSNADSYSPNTIRLTSNPQGFCLIWETYKYYTATQSRLYDIVASTYDNGSWSSPEILNADDTTNYDIVVEPSDNGYGVLWNYYTYDSTITGWTQHVYASVLTTSGWSATTDLALFDNQNFSFISNGSEFLFGWKDGVDVHARIFRYNSTAGAWQWEADNTISSFSANSYLPRFASNGTNFAAVWYEYDTTTYDTYIANRIYNPGSNTWEGTTRLSGTTASSLSQPELISNGDGYLAAFHMNGTAGIGLYSNEYAWDNGSGSYHWQTTAQRFDDSSTTTYITKLYTNGSGYAASWQSNTNNGFMNPYTYQMSTYGSPGSVGTWSTPVTLQSSNQIVLTGQLGNVETASDGSYHMSWIEENQNRKQLYASSHNGTSLATPTSIIQGSHEGSVIDVKALTNSSGDVLVLSTQFNEGYNDLYAQLYSNGSWSAQTLVTKRLSTSNTLKLETLNDDFIIVYNQYSINRDRTPLFSAIYSPSTGLATPQELDSNSYSWLMAAANNSLSIVTYTYTDISAMHYEDTLGNGNYSWSTPVPVSSTSSGVREVHLVSNGTGYAVSWIISYSENTAYANVYEDGVWKGETQLNTVGTNAGWYSYYGSPKIATDGTNYGVFWAETPTTTTDSDLFFKLYNGTSKQWLTSQYLETVAPNQIYNDITGTASGFRLNWRQYVNSQYDYYERYYLKPPGSSSYSWTPTSTPTCTSIANSLSNFYRYCSPVSIYEYDTTSLTWQWNALPVPPGLYSLGNMVIHPQGKLADSRYYYDGQLIMYNGTGWDTVRNFRNSDTTSIRTSQAIPSGDYFSYYWMQTDSAAADTTLRNAWIMPDLVP